ncbi:MAG: coenzyme F420-0:L-glutamate ligase [Muribaculaceae bacterium]|nr:coenzyme F420-0:L-glutamate ligase [Muribaculaceae bacterium]MBP5315382.1 coenzyme F420-0:L-glutamate ligase [Muribaculaceae bacterium]MBR5436468.1 coenzyme F420-0:L-glutamate ligase [Muribaculaceae bacterium]MBR5744217.1 coenzyme F420-0:L-glutamate ligase [Muribaculaceae bacterium]
MEFKANEGKNLNIEIDGVEYMRIPCKTHVVMKEDDLGEVLDKYTKDVRQPGDILFVSEKVVAITQGRAFPISEIKPSWLAKFLVKFVYKSPYGIGLGSPYTMQLAIKDVGVPRLLLGCLAAAVTKPFGVRGAFYKVCGQRAYAIDGPCDCTIPPYNRYAKMAPKDPDKVARKMKEKLGLEVIVLDANDLNVDILGKSSKDLDVKFLKALFKDNPLGQNSQQTPIALVRKA